jgi:hypothetical protein
VLSGSGIAAPSHDTAAGAPVSVIGSHLLDGKKDHRVPFLLKLPGQKDGVVYDRPFNTVLSHDLLLAVLRGALRDPAAVAAWLDAHDSSVNRRYNFKDMPFE